MSRRQVLSAAALSAVLGRSAEQVVTSMTGGARVPAPGGEERAG